MDRTAAGCSAANMAGGVDAWKVTGEKMGTKFEKLDRDKAQALIRIANQMREKSYCPYSGFAVGAALMTEQGRVYGGCNVENAAYSASICAERTAFVKAVSEGERSFRAIAIVGGKKPVPVDYSFPCGACRQFMREFCDPDTFEVITAISEEDYITYSLAQLLPESFGPGHLE